MKPELTIATEAILSRLIEPPTPPLGAPECMGYKHIEQLKVSDVGLIPLYVIWDLEIVDIRTPVSTQALNVSIQLNRLMFG